MTIFSNDGLSLASANNNPSANDNYNLLLIIYEQIYYLYEIFKHCQRFSGIITKFSTYLFVTNHI